MDEGILSTRKKKTISVNTPMGTRKVVLVYADQENMDPNVNFCEGYCKYAKICPHLPHPEEQDNKDLSFTDWCGDLEDRDSILKSYLPWEGVEDLYPKGSEAFQKLNAVDKLVPLSVIRNVVCKDMCLYYTEDGAGCGENRKECIIHDLLKQTRDKFPLAYLNSDGVPEDNRALTIEELEKGVEQFRKDQEEL